ncbi:MIR motif-containing protein [Globomyces pollinis-pini]|nr:MIR motif-containing protein [Globomyces pollinis-pini]
MKFIKFLCLFTSVITTETDFVIEKEFESVTCGSQIKLTHQQTGYKLHSHDVKYGSGSGQQSVTGFSKGNDPNSYFVVFGELNQDCERGKIIECGSTIRLKHQRTQKFLHSHLIHSPLSQQQEVSAHDSLDSGDNWLVKCNTKTWKREKVINLQHVDTKVFLSASGRYAFGNPINGQLEVCGRKYAGNDEQWIAQEGIYLTALETQ